LEHEQEAAIVIKIKKSDATTPQQSQKFDFRFCFIFIEKMDAVRQRLKCRKAEVIVSTESGPTKLLN